MAISLQTYNEILGKLVRKAIADSSVNDINPGSVLLTLLEAIAAQDFENSSSILSVLETLNIDALKNSDLDARASDYGLSRISASKASGFVTISDTSIKKRSTTLYGVKPAPIAGSTVIYVNNASGWDPDGGTLYIGRGTQQFEGPITYQSPDGGVTKAIVNNGSFYTIYLASALQKDHLSSDTVVDGQGTTDRVVSAGTVVRIPANNLSPEVRFLTLRNAVIPAGEDSISNVAIVAENAGADSNAGSDTIVQFKESPFTSAAVKNTSPVSGGKDIESDDDLRERLKNYSATLSRGTRAAILSAIVGVSDSTDGKQVSSATIQEPTTYAEPSLIYIDDGSGFQPSTQGQSVDVLLASAGGGEQFLQLSNFPIPRPQVVNQFDGPIELADGMSLVVSVDGVEQEVIFYAEDFANISAATLIEIATIINNQANKNDYDFRCRLASSSTRILLYPTKFNAEFIQVVSELPNGLVNANLAIGFPTNKYSYISLYKNNTLLKANETAATLYTLPSPWTTLISDGTLTLSVDGTPAQTAFFSSIDFDGAPFSSISASQWAEVINTKFAGVTATATSNGKIKFSSNKIGQNSSLKIIGGTYIDDWFSGVAVEAFGQASDFSLNRQTGNMRLSSPALAGDTITAGIADAKGYALSAQASSGLYELGPDGVGRPSHMVVAADSPNVKIRNEVLPEVGKKFKVVTSSTDLSVPSGIMRIVCDSITTLQNARIDDFIYIVYKEQEAHPTAATPTWFRQENTGLFKIISKGKHTTGGDNTYIDVVNVNAFSEPSSDYYSISATSDIQVFGSDVYPQVWKSSYVSETTPITLQEFATSLGKDLLNVKGAIFKSSAVKITSTTENDGSIAVPVSTGRLSLIVNKQDSQLGNQSHIATRINSDDMVTWFKRGSYIQRTSTNTVLPNRSRYSDLESFLSSDSIPGSDPEYAENLQSDILSSSIVDLDDLIGVNSGANKFLIRGINSILPGNAVGTRKNTPYTVFDYRAGDSIELIKSLSFASDDSAVFVLDGDAVNKTINVNFWRTGRVNSSIPASNSQFSANDADNEAGVNFGTMSVWSTSSPINTNFDDYAVWFRSRNWYKSGGSLSDGGTLIIRAKEYGPIGDSHRFSIDYPSAPNQAAKVKHVNNPEYTTTTYYFGSDSKRAIGIGGETAFSVKSLRTIQVTAEGSGPGQVSSGDYFYIQDESSPVVFWYDINNSGTATQPTVAGARYVKINSVNTGDSAATVAQKTRIAIDNDESFIATVLGDTISFSNNFNSLPAGAASQSGLNFLINEDTKTYRYSFPDTVNLSSVVVGDIVSIANSVTVSTGNSGTFRVNNVSTTGKYVDLYNPGATQTQVGRVEKVEISDIAAAGVKMVQTVETTPEGSGSGEVSNEDYFILNDKSGSVVFWYAVNNSGTAIQPTVTGASRFVKIGTVNTGDSAATVAQKTSLIVGSDTQFQTSYTLNNSSFSVTNNFIGAVDGGSSGSGLGFSFLTQTVGAEDQLGGKYFTVYDADGGVVVWLNVDGNPPPPPVSTNRAIQVSLSPGDGPSTVAQKIAAFIDSNDQFNASASGDTVTISNYYNGARDEAKDGEPLYSTGFTIDIAQVGQDDEFDVLISDSSLTVFPLLSTDVESIANVINTSQTLTAVYTGLATDEITRATKEELLSVSYGHVPGSESSWFVRMYDSSSWVKTFANSNPNFVLKKSLILQNQEPSIYNMATCPNPGTSDVGELFKLIPKTIKNVHHHMTHRAMSQLPIVADVDIAGNFKKIQIKSKKLGTQGGVEIVGGRANIGELDIASTASTSKNDDNTVNYLALTTQAYPNTFAKGDVVKVYNTKPAKRNFKPDATVTVEVKNDLLENTEYHIGSRSFNFSPYTRWSISDVSSAYGADAGIIWRWTHNNGGAKSVAKGLVRSYTISSIERVSGTATVTLTTPHDLEQGQKVVISGITDVPSFNGVRTITHTLGSTFKFELAGSDVSSNDNGSVVSVASQDIPVEMYSQNGDVLNSRLRAYDFSAGGNLSPFTVSLTVDNTPQQADYFYLTGPKIYSPGETKTFAIWFNRTDDGGAVAPSNTPGTAFSEASHTIRVDILGSDVPNVIVSKLSTALENDDDFSKYVSIDFVSGTNLDKIEAGDIVDVWPDVDDEHLTSNWPMGNQSQAPGASKISGLPVLSVNSTLRYMDILNPNGRSMSGDVFVGDKGNMTISPAIATKFRLKHTALNRCEIVVDSGSVTANTTTPHGFSVGDTVVIQNTTNQLLNDTFTITETNSSTNFKFNAPGVANNNYYGNCILDGLEQTRYRVSSLGFKNLFKIERTQGSSPRFADCGVCVDDFVQVSGSTFKTNNRVKSRILSVDNDSIVIQNTSGSEELNSYRPINYMKLSAVWTIGSNIVTGPEGAFANVKVGDWIKNANDDDAYFVQVFAMDESLPELATQVTLGQVYRGASSISEGIVCDFEEDAGKGALLLSAEDLIVTESDSVVIGDSLVIDSITNPDWFNSVNTGVRVVSNWGTNLNDNRQYLTVRNPDGVNQIDVKLSVDLAGFYLLENESSLYETIRTVSATSISESDFNSRVIYATPDDRAYKMSSDYGTKIASLGKMNFPLGAATGVDGYSYYTGLMRTAQRVIDGYEPDSATYPGRRAVGSNIELLPPLIKTISIGLDITTKDGVNLNDITNDIKSTIISYVSSLGVGQDVVLSEIIRRVKEINGVDAVTFTSPSPNEERIVVNDDERALTSPDLISLS